MRFIRVNSYKLTTEDGKYSIVKDFTTNSYYITSEGKKLIRGFSRFTFHRQKNAKAFVERLYTEELGAEYRWL